MEYTADHSGETLHVRISGVLTFDDHERFKAIVKLIASGDETQVTLDLGQTKMIDSAGIGMLLLANDKAVKESKKMSLTGINGHVAKVIELSKVDQIIPII